ncbi:hypothetical protein CDAR_526201 [Caerostris darwini]|uniref:Uncharacterized protein n=1 Tax=Caerostris darwini TaxID=1538125 RepID=A0AAV4UI09_9ARAC|nr:hypothetical protein CDAR_526201 [Caerostris darwini]
MFACVISDKTLKFLIDLFLLERAEAGTQWYVHLQKLNSYQRPNLQLVERQAFAELWKDDFSAVENLDLNGGSENI